MQYKEEGIRKKLRIPESVSFSNASLEGNIVIGEMTYVNEGSRIDTGLNAQIKIGNHCAIGRYVHITAKTHDLKRPTTQDGQHEILHIEADVTIGNCVWIGDNVTILPGVSVGDYAVIGAHSLVNKNVKSFEIVGGIPAKHIRFNTSHEKFQA